MPYGYHHPSCLFEEEPIEPGCSRCLELEAELDACRTANEHLESELVMAEAALDKLNPQ